MSDDKRWSSGWDDVLGGEKSASAKRDIAVPKAEPKPPPPRREVPLVIKSERPPAHYGDEYLDKPMEEVLREEHERRKERLDSLSNALGATPVKNESSGCAAVVGGAALLILLVVGGVVWVVQNASLGQGSALSEHFPVERPRGDGQGKLNGADLGGPGSVEGNSGDYSDKGGAADNGEPVVGTGDGGAPADSRDDSPKVIYELKDSPGREYILVSAFSRSRPSPTVQSLETGEELKYPPDNLVDEDLSTAWASVEVNEGRGETVEFRSYGLGEARGMEIYNGYQKIHPRLGDLFWLNNRVRRLRIRAGVSDPGPVIDIPDTSGMFTVEFAEPMPLGDVVSIEVVDVYLSRPRPGTSKRWAQVAISEVRFFK